MTELFLFDRALLRDLPFPERVKLKPILKRLTIPNGRPFVIGPDGLPNRDLEGFFNYLLHPDRSSPLTWKVYAEQVCQFIRYMEVQGKHWREVDREDLNLYYAVRSTGHFQNQPKIKSSSWNIAAAALVHLYEYAYEKGLVNALPFSYKRGKGSVFRKQDAGYLVAAVSVKNTPEPINFISLDIYKEKWRSKLATGLNAQRNLALSDLLLTSGLRIHEALGLTRISHEGIKESG
ncbi:site-specific integrase [Marinobacter sp.]|uniref:site-specific integrase n=1 Tax=Marinobacter sp. TaxID=50741 RepID=UPI003B516D7A